MDNTTRHHDVNTETHEHIPYHKTENRRLTQEELNEQAMQKLNETLVYLRNTKPLERSETARRYAVTITELEKTVAYFQVFVVDA